MGETPRSSNSLIVDEKGKSKERGRNYGEGQNPKEEMVIVGIVASKAT